VEFRLPDNFRSVQTTPQQLEQLLTWSVLLAVHSLVVMRETALDIEPGYEFQAQSFVNELLEDEYGFAVRYPEVLQALAGSLPVEHFRVDYASLPEIPADLPFEPILDGYHGMLHGLHAWLFHAPSGGYFSPGQVLDVHQLFELLEMNLEKLQDTQAKSHLQDFFDLFALAAQRKEAILYGDFDED